jgi:hypothetical protein
MTRSRRCRTRRTALTSGLVRRHPAAAGLVNSSGDPSGSLSGVCLKPPLRLGLPSRAVRASTRTSSAACVLDLCRAMRARPLSLSVLIGSVVVGCGRTDLLMSPVATSGEDTDGSTPSLAADACATDDEAGTPTDSSSLDGATVPCPPSPPASGSACTPNDISPCEYGSDPHCTTIAYCGNYSHVWHLDGPDPSCAGNSPQCPTSYDSPAIACPVEADGTTLSITCGYPRGRCLCHGCWPEDGGPMSAQWLCLTYRVPACCPEPRPLLGSPCTSEGQTCEYDYGTCAHEYYGLDVGPDMICTRGFWRPWQHGPISCEAQPCGQ